MNTPSVSAVLLCAGSGSRMGQNRPKQFLELLGKPILLYAFESLLGFPEIGEIIVVYRKENKKETESILQRIADPHPPIRWQSGGETRQESVRKGLNLCSYPVVLLHEAARPLVTAQMISSVLHHPSPAVTSGIEIPFTVLKKNDQKTICEILDRQSLFNVQLPQKFPTDLLRSAHRKAFREGKTYTDDSSLYFDAGYPCSVIDGSSLNIKVTRSEDLFLAERILNSRDREGAKC